MTYAIKNGVWSTVATGITSTATSLTVATGDGAKFGSPSTTNPVRCVVVDTSTTPETIKEYIDVTGVSTDTLTIVREVEESTRFPKVALTAGWYVAPVVTAGVLNASFAPSTVLFASGDTTGAADTAAIQAAIDAVNAAGGGVIDLVGTFWINATLTWKAGVVLRGQHWSRTVINLASGANCDMIQAATTLCLAGIRDLTLDGYKENQTSGHGINLNTLTAEPGRPTTPGGNGLFIERVLVRFCKQRGFTSGTTGNGSVELRLTSLYCWANDAEGMYIDGSDAFLVNCTAGDNVNAGIYINGGSNHLNNCKSWQSGWQSKNRANTTGYPTAGNSSSGFEIRGQNNFLTGCESQDNAGVGFNFGCDTAIAKGCVSDANSGVAYQLYVNARRQVIDGVIGNGTSHSHPSSLAVHIWDSSGVGNKVRVNWPNNTAGVTAGVSTSETVRGNLQANDIEIGTPNAVLTTTYAATVTPDPFYGSPEVTQTGNITIANPAGDRYVPNTEFEVHLIQDATGGRTVTWGADYIGMTAADTTASKTNIWKVRCRKIGSATKWYQVAYQAF